MNCKYMLINLIMGFIIGVLTVCFDNIEANNQKSLQAKLKKKNHESEECHKRLVRHFASSIKLLDSMRQNYRHFYQNIVKSSHELMLNLQIRKNHFNYHLTKLRLDNDPSSYQFTT